MLVFMTCAISAQEVYWTNYHVVVESQNEGMFYKLIDDYFTANKSEGVTVTLYENHFKDNGNKFTHSIGFSGSLDAIGAMYNNDGGAAWKLFLVQLNQHIKEGYGARMGTRIAHNGDLDQDYPVQRYFIVHADDGPTWNKAITKYMKTNKLPEMFSMMGNFTSGASPEGENRWVINGFKDFKSAIGGANAMRTDAQKKANDKAWKEFLDTNGASHLIRSGLRVRMGQWK